MARDIPATSYRRDNLREIADGLPGGQKELALKLDRDETQISQWIGSNPSRNISEKIAREIEARLGLAPYFLDQAPISEGLVDELMVQVIMACDSALKKRGTKMESEPRAKLYVLAYHLFFKQSRPPTSDEILRILDFKVA